MNFKSVDEAMVMIWDGCLVLGIGRTVAKIKEGPFMM
jgi:hypothetical protein